MGRINIQYVCMYVCICMYVCMYVRMYVCMYVCIRTVRYTDIPKISVLNQYRYIDIGYSTIPIYRNFRYTGIFRYTVLNLPTIWRNHILYFTTEWQFKELSTAMI